MEDHQDQNSEQKEVIKEESVTKESLKIISSLEDNIKFITLVIVFGLLGLAGIGALSGSLTETLKFIEMMIVAIAAFLLGLGAKKLN